jgi:hypothetical protein
MGILEKIHSALSPRIRLLDQLARSAGYFETLASNLKRDAERCAYPNIKAGLERLAVAETRRANELREILLARGVWPRPPDTSVRAGSSNWERLNASLALEVHLLRELNLQIAEWEWVEPALAERLREFTAEGDRSLAELRDLALRCDPQALD